MYQENQVVAFTPAGRRRYLEILLPYVIRDHEKGLIDEYHLWINTLNEEDIRWCRHAAETSGGWIRAVEAPQGTVYDGTYSIHHFYHYAIDPSAIYLRLDDDIAWIETGALAKLIEFRCKNPHYFLVFANTINNAICSHLHQRTGLVSDGCKLAGYHCLDPVGWNDPGFAEQAHRHFLEVYQRNELDRYRFDRWELNQFERFSINCMSFFGKDFAEFRGAVGQDEESWLTQQKPFEIGRMNAICGKSLVSHFAFQTQREHLEQTNLLGQYRALCAHECSRDPWTFTIDV